MESGIISCGVYIPKLRIKREEYQRVWGYFSPRLVEEKSVADFDEDPITMGVEAASNALRNATVEASAIEAVYFASTSPPYAEKQNASTIATALGCRNNTATLDVTSSTRSGASALLSCLDFVGSGRGTRGLVIAADCPVGDPTAPIEHQLGAGAAAVIVGRERLGATVDGSASVVSEGLGERFRRDGSAFVTALDLGTYHDAILDHAVSSCMKSIMEKLGRTSRDYDWLVLQGLDGAKSLEISKRLGFEESKITPSLVSTKIGDVGAASSILALSKLLELAIPRQRGILCSYGPGAGAEAFSFAVEREMKPIAGAGYEDYLARKEYIDYATYLKLRRLLAKS